MSMIEKFEVIIASPPDYDDLVAEIYYGGRFVALISQERGPGLFELETPQSAFAEKDVLRKVDLDGFKNAVETACNRLRRGRTAWSARPRDL